MNDAEQAAAEITAIDFEMERVLVRLRSEIPIYANVEAHFERLLLEIVQLDDAGHLRRVVAGVLAMRVLRDARFHDTGVR